MSNLPKRLLLRSFGAMPRSWTGWFSRLRWRNAVIDRLMTFAAAGLRDCDLEIQQGLGSGLRFNAGGAHPSFLLGTCEPNTQTALKAMLREGMVFYDVGANVGYFSVIAARLVGPHGKVICFEPLPENTRRIEHNAAMNGFDNIRAIEVALGNIDGESSFWLSEQLSWGKLASAGKQPNRTIGTAAVSVRRLDAMVAEEGLAPPEVIKIDVEGAEVDALFGLEDGTVRAYLSNKHIIEGLAREFGFHCLFFWQPMIFTKARPSRYERSVEGEVALYYPGLEQFIEKPTSECSKLAAGRVS